MMGLWFLLAWIAADRAMRVVIFMPPDWIWLFTGYAVGAAVSVAFGIFNFRHRRDR